MTVSNHAVRSTLLREAPSRRNLAMPSSISATVTADRNKVAECKSIQSTKLGGIGRDGAAAEMTLVSTRYTGGYYNLGVRKRDLLRLVRSPDDNGAAINRRPRLGTVESRSHSS